MTKDYKSITVEQLSKVLYQVDPCNIAYHPDDYKKFAAFALGSICNGLNIVDSIKNAIEFMLTSDYVIDITDDSIRKILNKISKLIKKNDQVKNLT